ncbi:unnamed protein product [Acanthoscelides obtectus]|uniref:Histone-lysine N-methyltransferase SETMAR n=1 Tax=Acanthoscelides obtectus TaxID=200917 RepID=A0A9P0M705_ACAOB|nr:unnamed protein product [Acanthoscelides obtectus]CAK1627298.1 hypothetical protein AOBTE_LOCUS4494 [Acanthoscelides obtectus]
MENSNVKLLLRIGIPPFVCQKSSPSFEKSTPKEESSSTKTMQARIQPKKTRQYLTKENVELLDHPPYSPDLSSNDFFTFTNIKNGLRDQRFQSPEKAVDAFKNPV